MESLSTGGIFARKLRESTIVVVWRGGHGKTSYHETRFPWTVAHAALWRIGLKLTLMSARFDAVLRTSERGRDIVLNRFVGNVHGIAAAVQRAVRGLHSECAVSSSLPFMSHGSSFLQSSQECRVP